MPDLAVTNHTDVLAGKATWNVDIVMVRKIAIQRLPFQAACPNYRCVLLAMTAIEVSGKDASPLKRWLKAIEDPATWIV